jgi:hypothetical protein
VVGISLLVVHGSAGLVDAKGAAFDLGRPSIGVVAELEAQQGGREAR